MAYGVRIGGLELIRKRYELSDLLVTEKSSASIASQSARGVWTTPTEVGFRSTVKPGQPRTRQRGLLTGVKTWRGPLPTRRATSPETLDDLGAGATRRRASAARRPLHARPRWRRSSQARQPWPRWTRRRKSLDAQGLTPQGLPEQHDGSRRSPVLSSAGTLRARGWRPPREPQDPISPPWACGWGAANPASPNGSPGQRDRYR